jgi:enhancing lycopene biosynthesis protein 2
MLPGSFYEDFQRRHNAPSGCILIRSHPAEELMSVRVGVVLSGCGFQDGTEIHEAVSILVALDRRGATAVCLAPSIPQSVVINHLTGKPGEGRRNVLEESARIARGKIKDVAEVTADDLDALVFPGGFGAALNLSDFATRGADAVVQKDVSRLIQQMHAGRKPIGFACISPVLAAKVLGQAGVAPKLTIGQDQSTATAINAMGAEHHNAGPTDVVIDEANRLISTPCYMNDVGPWVVFEGAEKLVEELLRLFGDPASVVRGHMANR